MRRLRIILAPVGTRGDVQPMLGLARALTERGHDVALAVADTFHALATTTVPKARVVAGGGDPQAIIRQERGGIANPRTFLRLARDEVQKQFAFLDDAVASFGGAQVDVIVGTMLLGAGSTVAAAHGARAVGVAYFPHLMPTKEVPSIFWPHAPRPFYAFTWWAYLKSGEWTLLPIINAERKKRGLRELDSFMDDEYRLAGPLVCAFDDAFATVPRDWPGVDATATGFFFVDDGPALPTDLERFLDAGDPPLFVSFGSMPTDDPKRTTHAIRDAVAQTGRRAIVGAGWAGIGESIGGDRVFVVDGEIDHRRLFPRCAAVVHHGGAGTTAQAARAGVPQIVVPHMFDQHFWAARVRDLGVGTAPLSKRFTAAQLAGAVDRVCGPRADEAIRHRVDDVATRLRGTDGIGVAADLIERCVA